MSYFLPKLLWHSLGEPQIKCWLWRHFTRNTFLTSREPYKVTSHLRTDMSLPILNHLHGNKLLGQELWVLPLCYNPEVSSPEAVDSDWAGRKLSKGCFKSWYFPKSCYSPQYMPLLNPPHRHKWERENDRLLLMCFKCLLPSSFCFCSLNCSQLIIITGMKTILTSVSRTL